MTLQKLKKATKKVIFRTFYLAVSNYIIFDIQVVIELIIAFIPLISDVLNFMQF